MSSEQPPRYTHGDRSAHLLLYDEAGNLTGHTYCGYSAMHEILNPERTARSEPFFPLCFTCRHGLQNPRRIRGDTQSVLGVRALRLVEGGAEEEER